MARNDHAAPPEGPLVDPDQLGRLLRAARIIAGFDNVHEAIEAMRLRTGFAMTDRTLYALERGEQKATLEQVFAAMATYLPPSPRVYFLPAFREDIQAMLTQGVGFNDGY